MTKIYLSGDYLKPQVGDYITSFKLIMYNNRALLVTSFERTRERGVRPLIYEITSDVSNFTYCRGKSFLPYIPSIEDISYWLYNTITKIDGTNCYLHTDIDDESSDYLMFTTDECNINVC